MRSQLTRSVFRKLLSNEGLIFPCPTQHSLLRNASPFLHRCSQRRTMFGFSAKPPRKPKQPDLTPGLSTFAEMGVMLRIGARTPPAEEVVKAWRAFFQYKHVNKEPVNRLQAKLILRTFEHLKKETYNNGIYIMSTSMIRSARKAFLIIPKDEIDLHIEIAKVIYEEFVRRDCATPIDVAALIEALCQTGESAAAQDIAFEHFKGANSNNDQETGKIQLAAYKSLLAGFAREDNETALLETAEMMLESGLQYTTYFQQIMVSFFAARDNMEALKTWYSKPVEISHTNARQSPVTLAAILKFCIRNNELDWGKTVFRELSNANLTKECWDVIFQWAAGAVGKGVEDVKRMMDVMVRRYPDDEQMRPDISTINGLVEVAMSRNDPYLAERYLGLGLKSGILPNANTYILQMNYRINAGDLTGAQTAYRLLQSEELLENEDLPVVNKYIQALCGVKTHHDDVQSILQDLEARKVRLEPNATLAVAMMYFERDEIQDVYDILQTNVHHFSISERGRMLQAFFDFCMDRNNSNSRAWDSYQILRQIFDETNTAQRTELMNEFFDRGRADMACYVFGHMRQHLIADRKPNLDTYIQCFEGIARCADAESLDMVHNMFKMDSTVEPNTKLYNSLILAYSSVGDGHTALGFWDDITNSIEGPSYQSLVAVFRACETEAFGDTQAREIWAKINRMEIEITRDVFVAYVAALAGRGCIKDAMAMVDKAEKEFGIKPDFMTFGIMYNSILGQNRKDQVAEWAKGMYSEAWAELEKLGQTEYEESIRQFEEEHRMFNIKREVRA